MPIYHTPNSCRRVFRSVKSNDPVICTIQVTRIHVRRYSIRFATFAEAARRLMDLKSRYSAFQWLKTEKA